MFPLFPLGQIVATPGALAALERAKQLPTCFVARHAIGDWKSHRGSVRQFFNPTRSLNLVSFHEPHSGDTLHKATLYVSTGTA